MSTKAPQPNEVLKQTTETPSKPYLRLSPQQARPLKQMKHPERIPSK